MNVYVASGSESDQDGQHAAEPSSQGVARRPERRDHTEVIETERARNARIRQNTAFRRETQPVDPTERLEQYYGTQPRARRRHPAKRSHEKHSKHVDSLHGQQITIEEPSKPGPKSIEKPPQIYLSKNKAAGPHVVSKEPGRRRVGRKYPDTPPLASSPPTGHDQSSHEMLDDYYDGFDDTVLPETTAMGILHVYEASHVPTNFGPGLPPPPLQDAFTPYAAAAPDFPSRPPYRPRKRKDYLVSVPHRTAIWDRAAVWNTEEEKYDISLKLVLTRHGERYSGDGFPYRSKTWNDIVFARKLNQQYRSLKTAKVGIVQKLTAYKKISFVYFVQFHAFPDIRYPATGAWLRTDRRPITFQDNAMTRNSFMNQLRRMCQKNSILYNTLTGTPNDHEERPPIRWVERLDELIEAGAVIDIDVKETFDSTKIYMALLLAIILSLGVALGYGFAMDNDFSTGFSIASWVITALGFLAAVVAAGEYLGLDSPKATLMDADGYERPYR